MKNELILAAVRARLARMLKQMESPDAIKNIAYMVDDADDDALNQKATDLAVEGDYLGAIICEEAAK